MSALDLIRAGAAEPCRPWPRHVLTGDAWRALAAALPRDAALTLTGIWADTLQVHALFHDGTDPVLASLAVENGRYPALSPACPTVAPMERMIRDLWGHTAEGGDERTWLDHGRWPLAHPLSPRPGLPGGAVEPPILRAPHSPQAMQVPIGPIHGLIEEPAHLRLTTRGDTVLRAEARLGYAHKGTLALMRGKSPRTAARFVARLAAETTVAHSLAFARAAEAALDTHAPPRAAALRQAMAAQEQIAGDLDLLAQMADAAGLAALHAALGRQRELGVRAAELAFGHRLMMDVAVPGGVAADIAPEGADALLQALDALEDALPGLIRRSEPLQARLADLGDATRRCRARLAAIAARAQRLRALLEDLPEGAILAALPAESGEGVGGADSQRGRIWHWLRLDHGQIAAAFPCDPGWLLWPAFEADLAATSAEDAAMLGLSYGLPCSALDL